MTALSLRVFACAAMLFVLVGCGNERTAATTPVMIAPPTSVDFGTAPVLNEVVRTLPISNVGRGTLRILNLAVREAGTAFSVGEVPPEIAPGIDASIELRFVPPTEAAFAATLVLETDDPATPLLEIGLTGVGSTVAVMTVEPLALDFGRVAEGSAAVRDFTVRSLGNAPLVIQELGFTNDASGAFAFGGSVRTPATVAPSSDIQLSVRYAVVEGAPDAVTGEARIVGTDPNNREVRVALSGTVNRAPVAVIAPPGGTSQPGDTVTLVGTDSYDPDGDAPLTYEWRIVRQPQGASATLATPTAATTSLTLDSQRIGSYDLELEVRDALGARSLRPAKLSVVATAPQQLRVEMFWFNSVTDVDLHVLRNASAPLNSIPDDCGHWNRNPDWGVVGDASDNPTFLNDAKTGYGPEVFGYATPADGTYRVAAVLFNEQLAANPASEVRIRIYVRGVLQAQFTRVLQRAGDTWYVADIQWPSGTITEVSP